MKLIEEMLGDVQRFNEEIVGLQTPGEPWPMSSDVFVRRTTHLKEELEELRNASDWEGQADALVDLIYVALGGLVEMGVTPGFVFDLVHDANMRKRRGTNQGRPDSGGDDAIKPEGWNPPDLSAALPLSVLRYLSHVLIECAELRRTRDDYNQTEEGLQGYFPFGHMSYSQMVHVKATRLKSLMNAEVTPGEAVEFDAKLRDTLLDVINYSTYWVEAIDRGDRL
jgi:predicted HAD superfamily Cof-like phosphohydrolase